MNTPRTSKPRLAMLDLSIPATEQSRITQVLSSEDFLATTLRKVARMCQLKRYARLEKPRLATFVAQSIVQDKSLVQHVCKLWFRQPRRWLASRRVSRLDEFPSAISVAEALSGPTSLASNPGPQWYGPLSFPTRRTPDAEPELTHYYLRAAYVPHYSVADAKQYYLRWHVILEIKRGVLALHWDGFSAQDSATSANSRQFPFWRELDGIWKEVEYLLGVGTAKLDLRSMVLHKMWAKYASEPIYEWRHERINSLAKGITLHARAGRGYTGPRGTRKRMADLTAFCREMSLAILSCTHAPQVPDATLKRLGSDAATNFMIRQWDPRSYEFSLLHNNPNLTAKKRKICRAHVIFGAETVTRPGGVGEWDEQYIECYLAFGGSGKCLQLILEILDEERGLAWPNY